MLSTFGQPQEAFPERRPAVSAHLPYYCRIYIYARVCIHTHKYKNRCTQFHAQQTTSRLCPSPASWQHLAPGSQQLSEVCSPRRGQHFTGSPGRGHARERPSWVCSHAQGVFTEANRPVFPSPKVFLAENGYLAWYHLVCNRNKRAPEVYTSLPQPDCLRVSGAFTEILHVPGHLRANFWNLHCN